MRLHKRTRERVSVEKFDREFDAKDLQTFLSVHDATSSAGVGRRARVRRVLGGARSGAKFVPDPRV